MDKSNGIEHYEKKLKKKNHSKNLKTKKKKNQEILIVVQFLVRVMACHLLEWNK